MGSCLLAVLLAKGDYRGSFPRFAESNITAWKSILHEAERKVAGGSYGQAIKVTSVGKTPYIDEGQGWGG